MGPKSKSEGEENRPIGWEWEKGGQLTEDEDTSRDSKSADIIQFLLFDQTIDHHHYYSLHN